MARAARGRARQHPRRARVVDDRLRAGGRPAYRRATLALLERPQPRKRGRARLEELLALPGASPPTRATGQAAIASLAQVQGDHDAVRRMLDESLPILRLAGKDRCLSLSLGLLGMTALATGDIDEAHALTQEELEQARRTGDPFVQSYALAHVGTVLAGAGRHDEAAEALEEAVRLAEKSRQPAERRRVADGAGWARAASRRARAGGRSVRREPRRASKARRRVGSVALPLEPRLCRARRRRDDDGARPFGGVPRFDKASDHYQPGLANDLELVARLAAAGGRTDRAVRMFSAAARVRESVGVHAMEVWWPDPAPHVGELPARLTDVEFEQAWAQGRGADRARGARRGARRDAGARADAYARHGGLTCRSRRAASHGPGAAAAVPGPTPACTTASFRTRHRSAGVGLSWPAASSDCQPQPREGSCA